LLEFEEPTARIPNARRLTNRVQDSKASGAIFLMLEMYDPVGGLVKIPVTPLLTALENIGR
jgi:hypothetical protein